MKIYLDNSTKGRPSEGAMAILYPFLAEHWGANQSAHAMGQELFPSIQEAVRSILSVVEGKMSDQLIFTSSGPEAVNQVLMSAYFSETAARGKNQYICSSIDEASFLMGLERLEKLACVAKYVTPNKLGFISAEEVKGAITPRTALVTLSAANGLTGVIQPIDEIAALCQERGILLHLDVSHTLGKLYMDMTKADFITFSGDLLHAPSGTGVFFAREGVACHPLICGGMEQEGLRGGNIPVGLLASLGVACKEAQEAREYLCTEVARLRNLLEYLIVSKYPEAIPFYQDVERLPHISCIGFKGICNEALLFALSKRGVMATIGGGSFQQIALVLASSGVDQTLANSSISFSLSRYNNEGEVERAAQIIVEEAKKLRELSRGIV